MMTDPIADLFTRLHNASLQNHRELSLRFSRVKENIARMLKQEGFIQDFQVTEEEKKVWLTIDLLPRKVLHIKRISKPGRRVYTASDSIKKVKNDLGILIISTSGGLMSNKEARKKGVGGEVLCEIY